MRDNNGEWKRPTKTNDRLRASKMITTFGPGSIYDLPEGGSVMVMGTDFWRNNKEIYEPRLAKELDVEYFGQPTSEGVDRDWPDVFLGIPVRDFPLNRVCPECKRLINVSKLKGGKFCPYCTTGIDHKVKTFPPRLVMGCKKGHIEDFPWKDWVGCTCPNPDLLLHGNNGESTESDMMIECKRCKKSRGFEGALKTHEEYNCHGHRPWLGNDEEDCDEKLTGLMRGSSRVYFPVIHSSLLIPPYSNPLHEFIRPFLKTARGNHLNGTLNEYVNKSLIPYNAQLMDFMKKEDVSQADVQLAFDEAFNGPPSRGQIKEDEWEMLTHDQKGGSNSDFHTERMDITDDGLGMWFSSVRRVIKLKEIIAIQGFTRVEPYDGDESRLQDVRLKDSKALFEKFSATPELGSIYQSPLDGHWLPGVELVGEGIFFQFKESMVEEWEKCMQTSEKYKSIASSFKTAQKDRQGIDLDLPRTILVHSFAHQLIRQISLSCGYGMASLRERIYSTATGKNGKSKTMVGLLIYTSSPDSEGTLGGLVAQAEDEETLMTHVQSCLESVRICSQDPLCGYHDPMATKNPWGASCHSCMHVPETSCEGLQNRLLDRFSLIGDEKYVGYFYGR